MKDIQFLTEHHFVTFDVTLTGLSPDLCLAGAVAARMRVFDSGVTIIAAHLSSGEQEGDELKRNYDYSEIVRRGQFPPDGSALEPDSLQAGGPSDVKIAGQGKSPGQWGRFRGLMDSSHVFWMGDLNYRLSMPDAEVNVLPVGSQLLAWQSLEYRLGYSHALTGCAILVV